MSGIKIVGLEQLEKKLKSNVTLNNVKRVVRKNGSDLQTKIQRNADFKKGYQTGATHDSIRLDITDGGMTAESGPTTEYSRIWNMVPALWLLSLLLNLHSKNNRENSKRTCGNWSNRRSVG